MKKVLSVVFSAAFAATMFSQTLMADDFNSYNTGNLGTQGGWGRDGGANNMAKIATIDAAHGKSLQMASTAANAAGMFIYKEFDWFSKADGNDVFVAEFELYPTATSPAEIQVYDAAGGEYYAIFDIYMAPGVGVYLADQADFDDETNGELLTDNVTANTWYKVKVTYDTLEGSMKVNINGTEYGPYAKAANYYPTEVDIVSVGVNNAGFDNIKMSAEAALAVNSTKSKFALSVYPNPATDVINLRSAEKISEISIFDLSGKLVKTAAETSVNVQDLAKGSYVVSVKYANGSTETKKVIKK
ncbi:T9SS type A sorting domain-containing protein [Kaistella palustris]|uniref:T9SS type A sorting domain-containing protein n=1 Tax=Kaistella palustris TaxID=493376 RepID=UPI00040C2320|nr:T9SS type A sorting domain-containing protein [Kaistella palustris]